MAHEILSGKKTDTKSAISLVREIIDLNGREKALTVDTSAPIVYFSHTNSIGNIFPRFNLSTQMNKFQAQISWIYKIFAP